MTGFLEAEGIFHRYGAVQALDGVDISLEPGGSAVLLGPNGAGKSTLLGILAGRMRPSRGRVRVGGFTAGRDSRARSLTGYLSHAPVTYPGLTAEENLVFFGRLAGLQRPEERAGELLTLMGLAHRRADAAGTFSRGMAQRLSIARALIHDPMLLILDEPFSGLDYQASRNLAELIALLRDGRRTFVMATHDLDTAGVVGGEAIVLSGGRVVHRGPASDDLREVYARIAAGCPR